MPYVAPPAKNEVSATPSPSNAVAKAGIGKLWDWLTALFGTGGKPEHVYAAMKLLDPKAIYNLAPTFAVGANALTITFADKDGNALSADNPAFVGQRHATLSNGGFLQRKLEANVALVISSGSTLGHVNAEAHPIFIYAIDNAAVFEPAVSSTYHGPSGIITTIAEGGAGAADSATAMYSTTARANVPFRCIGRAISTQAVAGTWAALPALVEPPSFDERDANPERPIASAATTDIGTVASRNLEVTGNTGITSFGTTAKAGASYKLRFSTGLTITHHASNMICPGARNLVIPAGGQLEALHLGGGRWVLAVFELRKQPTRTVITSGSGTYNTPAGATRIDVRVWGGGAGGDGGGSNGTAGGNSSFSTLAANGGANSGGAGGTASGGDVNLTGCIAGGASSGNGAPGGHGGTAPMMGAFGVGGQPNAGGGKSPPANTGGGAGGGGGTVGAAVGAAGGSAGGYCQKLILAPAVSYSYAVGAAGSGGTGGGSIGAGGNGAAGMIIIDEFYD